MAEKQQDLQLIKRITECVNKEWPIFLEKWSYQEKGYDYLRSEQYTPAMKSYYDAQKRPTNVFNMIFERFNHILGDHFLNDQRQRVTHKAGGDANIAQVWEDVLDHYHSLNDYRMELGRTVLAGWIGCGIIYPRWSDEHDIDGGIVYTNIDEFDVMWDSRSRSYFLDDAQYVIRHRWMSAEEIIRQWPQHRRKINELIAEKELPESDYDRSEWRVKAASDEKFVDKRAGKYRIVEFHEMPYEMTEIIYDPMTKEANVFGIGDERRRKMYFKANPHMQLVERRAPVKYITTIIPALQMVLSREKAATQDGTYDIIPYHPYPYGRFAVDHFGLMRVIIEPQDFLNDMMNRTLDVMNKSANAGAEVVEDAYENPEDAIRFGAQPGVVLRKKREWADKDGTYRRFDPPRIDTAAYQMTQDAKYFIEVVSNTTENLIGRKESSSEPASLYAQRVAQAQVKFAVPTYCLNSVKTRLNQKMIWIGQSNIPSNKLFLMMDKKSGETKELFVNLQAGDKILNNLETGEYEVIVDNINMNPTAMLVRNERKMKFVEMIAQLFGPNAAQAIDWEWAIGDIDLGDIQSQLDRINQVVGAQAQAQAQQEALMTSNALLDTANKEVSMLDQVPQDAIPSGNPAPGGPAPL